MTPLRTRIRAALQALRSPIADDDVEQLKADLAHEHDINVAKRQEISRLEAEVARLGSAETQRARAEAQLRKVLQQGADPYIRDTLLRIKGVAIDTSFDSDLCFIGPNGCTTHPGWNLNGECGIAWVRSWLYDDEGKQSSADTRALIYVINDAESPDGLPNDALAVLRDALTVWLKETPEPGPGGPDWGDREKRRLANAMLKTLPS